MMYLVNQAKGAQVPNKALEELQRVKDDGISHFLAGGSIKENPHSPVMKGRLFNTWREGYLEGRKIWLAAVSATATA